MGLLNGLGGLAAGLSSFADNASKDRAATPLLETPAAPVEAAPAAKPDTWSDTTADAPAAVAKAGAGAAGVPPKLLPIYEAAARRTGIPVAVLIAQGKQESGFDPSMIGSAGEIGIHQIKPSTAREPGYGVKPINPSELTSPEANINFAADYLRARAGLGVDFSDPRSVDMALARYNSGGDKNYVANVRRYMGGA